MGYKEYYFVWYRNRILKKCIFTVIVLCLVQKRCAGDKNDHEWVNRTSHSPWFRRVMWNYVVIILVFFMRLLFREEISDMLIHVDPVFSQCGIMYFSFESFTGSPSDSDNVIFRDKRRCYVPFVTSINIFSL